MMETLLESVSALPHQQRDRTMRHSDSYRDVRDVDAGHADPPPPLKKIRKSSIHELLHGQMKAMQEHEDDIAQCVIVCEPEGSSLMMGGLHPRGSLYERPVNIDTAKTQHTHFRQVRVIPQ